MSKELELDGKSYITSKRAAEITGYAQDYIGQLARGGEIDARKIDGSWYVVLESLSAYGTEAEAKPKVVPEPQQREAANDTIVSFDGKEFISSKRGAELSGYSQDYVGQLARGGKILSRQVGSKWYVAKNELLNHKSHNDSLLAAVQAESVGLKRHHDMPIQGKETPKPLMTYHNEAAFDLMPILEEKATTDLNISPESENIHINHSSDSRETDLNLVDGEEVPEPVTRTEEKEPVISAWQPVPVTVVKKQSAVDFWETGVELPKLDKTDAPARRRRLPRMLQHKRMLTTAALSIVIPTIFIGGALAISVFGTNPSGTTSVAQGLPYADAKSTELAAAAAVSIDLTTTLKGILSVLFTSRLHFQR